MINRGSTVRAVVICVAFMAAAAACHAAAKGKSNDSVGKVVSIRGSVTAGKPRSDDSRMLMLNGKVFRDDEIVCGPGSRVEIQFSGGSTVSLGADSQLAVEDYVFAPQARDSSVCHLRFVRGACRVVSGMITRLNPDAFKVRTRMATIGIRGCEVGIQGDAAGDDIFVIEIGEGESVVVETTRTGTPMMDPDTGEVFNVDDRDRTVVNVDESGLGISVAQGSGLNIGPLNQGSLRPFMTGTSHLPSARYDLHPSRNGSIVILKP